MFKKIVIGILALLMLVPVGGLLLPRTVHVTRSVSIERPASLVFATINSFQLFDKWSPWQDLDPNMHQNTEGPRDGVGAKLIWSGNTKVHTGSYGAMIQTHDKLLAYLASHSYKRNGAAFYWFVDDPGNTPEDRLHTEVYAPIE